MSTPEVNNNAPFIYNESFSQERSVTENSTSSIPNQSSDRISSFSSVKNLFKGKEAINSSREYNSMDQIGQRPLLEKPFSSLAETDELVHQLYKNQSKIIQESRRLEGALMTQTMKEKEELHREYIKLKEEAEQRKKASKIFSWMGIASGILGGTFLVATLAAASLGTAGIGLGAFFAAAGGLATICGGNQKIIGSVFSYLGDKSMGDSVQFKEESNLKKGIITQRLDNIQQHDNSFTQLWGNASQFIKNEPKIFK